MLDYSGLVSFVRNVYIVCTVGSQQLRRQRGSGLTLWGGRRKDTNNGY